MVLGQAFDVLQPGVRDGGHGLGGTRVTVRPAVEGSSLCQQKLTAAQFVKTVLHDAPAKRKWFLRLLREGVSRVHRDTEADLQALADRLDVSLTD